MNNRILSIVSSVFLLQGIGLAQTNKTTVAEDFKPSSVNQPGKQFPQVNSEGCVRASISAPQANKVQLESPGTAHEWLTWRRSLHQYAQLLFKN